MQGITQTNVDLQKGLVFFRPFYKSVLLDCNLTTSIIIYITKLAELRVRTGCVCGWVSFARLARRWWALAWRSGSSQWGGSWGASPGSVGSVPCSQVWVTRPDRSPQGERDPSPVRRTGNRGRPFASFGSPNRASGIFWGDMLRRRAGADG